MRRKSERYFRIGVSGSPYFVDEVCRATFSSVSWKLTSLNGTTRWKELCDRVVKQDLWYRIGGYFTRTGESNYENAVNLGVQVVIHWIGTDILALADYLPGRPDSLRVAKRFTHWTTVPRLVDELATLGIEASCVPLPIHKRLRLLSTPPPPLPDRFAVYTYIVDNRPELYGLEHILKLANDFPDIEINVVHSKGRCAKDPLPNLHFHGWVDNVEELYARCTVAVRMTQHDGLSGSIQEPLLMGRHAIWTYPFPGVRRADDYPALRRHIEQLHGLHQAGQLDLNWEGRYHIQEHLHPEKLAQDVRRRMKSLLEKHEKEANVELEIGEAHV